MAERSPDFEIKDIQELQKNSENHNTKKSTSTWLSIWTSLGRKQARLTARKIMYNNLFENIIISKHNTISMGNNRVMSEIRE